MFQQREKGRVMCNKEKKKEKKHEKKKSQMK
jgi:hypothetical protein